MHSLLAARRSLLTVLTAGNVLTYMHIIRIAPRNSHSRSGGGGVVRRPSHIRERSDPRRSHTHHIAGRLLELTRVDTAGVTSRGRAQESPRKRRLASAFPNEISRCTGLAQTGSRNGWRPSGINVGRKTVRQEIHDERERARGI